ncbi:MAG: pantetheine-phosphate adenylyltransferase [Hyphomicrobiales bacterium]|nr:pantetheine-phosphate adenylyltransferase [Hyphomicrobiales bacterium]MCY4032573.1 pantetheine-phosphate adenylyltransferase [Hyphomicrobiales bacterium]MCY4037976.1 pantetheine-phosphate adenylyltransferase [Hyphomicrobiales bacterium]
MKIATLLYPGTFDPITNGHVDILRRACSLADKIVVAVASSEEKGALFSQDERLEMVRMETKRLSDETGAAIEAVPFDGLLVEFVAEIGADAILRGLRGGDEYAYESRMAVMNRMLRGVETIFLPASGETAFLSSSLVRQIHAMGRDVGAFVSPAVRERMARMRSNVSTSPE